MHIQLWQEWNLEGTVVTQATSGATGTFKNLWGDGGGNSDMVVQGASGTFDTSNSLTAR